MLFIGLKVKPCTVVGGTTAAQLKKTGAESLALLSVLSDKQCEH